jgi:hypothetical protein
MKLVTQFSRSVSSISKLQTLAKSRKGEDNQLDMRKKRRNVFKANGGQ